MKSIAIAGAVQGAPTLYAVCHPLEAENLYHLEIGLGNQALIALITDEQLQYLSELLRSVYAGRTKALR
jgi:hypothetical protein